MPNPNIAGSICPDLTAVVRAKDGPAFSPPPRQCVISAFAPIGGTLRVGSYPKAAFVPAADTAGFSINCALAATQCGGNNVSSFTLHELQSNPSGVVTRLHMTFEQTCLDGALAVGFFGKGSGELWIVDGAAP